VLKGMEEYEVRTIARYEAEEVVERAETRLEKRIRDVEEGLGDVEDKLYITKSEIIRKLEVAILSLQSCSDVKDVVEAITTLLNDLVKILNNSHL